MRNSIITILMALGTPALAAPLSPSFSQSLSLLLSARQPKTDPASASQINAAQLASLNETNSQFLDTVTATVPTTQLTAPADGYGELLNDINDIPGLGLEVNALSNVLTDFEQKEATALGVDTTLSNKACAAMSVIFARGTTEAGNVGLLTGPPFFSALEQIMGKDNVAVQGVSYAADIDGFLQGGDDAGAEMM